MFVLFSFKEPKRGMYSQKDLTFILHKEKIEYRYQLTRETFRKTIIAPTNLIAFFEGIFTWLIMANTLYLIYPYIQYAPYNISPVMSSLFMTVFGVPGAIIGALTFGRLSDRLGAKNLKNRVLLIVASLFVILISVIMFFAIPLPSLRPDEGNTLSILLGYPMLWVLCVVIFILRAVIGIYNINQNPILQAVNLPEAQGQVMAFGQFLETISMGLGPLIACILLTANGGNYLLTSLFLCLLGLPGPILWLFALKTINKDHIRVQNILKERANELQFSSFDR